MTSNFSSDMTDKNLGMTYKSLSHWTLTCLLAKFLFLTLLPSWIQQVCWPVCLCTLNSLCIPFLGYIGVLLHLLILIQLSFINKSVQKSKQSWLPLRISYGSHEMGSTWFTLLSFVATIFILIIEAQLTLLNE